MHRLLSACRRLGFVAALFAVHPASAETMFYQGKQLSLVVNFSQGGPSDAEARLLARHLGRLIAGNPTVTVKNIGGAGGLAAVNWLAKSAPADGHTLAYFTGIVARAVLGDPALEVDAASLTFVAAGPGANVTYARTDIGGGIKIPTDLLRKRDFWAGGLAPDNDKDIRMRMQLDLLGIKHNYVAGFQGSADARLAFQRGEIQHHVETLPTYRSVIEPGPVKTGQAIPVWIDPLDDGQTFTRPPEADGIPAATFTELLKQHEKGELPKSELFEVYRLINRAGTQFYRVLLMPPGTPGEPVKAIQAALARAASDAEVREDAIKSLKFIPVLRGDAAIAEQYRTVTTPSAQLKSFTRAYIERGRPDAPKADAPKKAGQ